MEKRALDFPPDFTTRAFFLPPSLPLVRQTSPRMSARNLVVQRLVSGVSKRPSGLGTTEVCLKFKQLKASNGPNFGQVVPKSAINR
jgi:hypothetical protein